MYSLPKIDIPEDDRKVLEYMIKNYMNGQSISSIDIKIDLFEKLSEQFNHKKLNPLLIQSNMPTLYGLWVHDQNYEMLEVSEKIIFEIRDKILSKSKDRSYTSHDLSKKLKINIETISICFELLSTSGAFWSAASRANDLKIGYSSIDFDNETCIEEYLSFLGLENHLENWIKRIKPTNSVEKLGIKSNSYISGNQFERNTAFIIMAMDPEKPELEDVHTAIKESCEKFGIKAVRVDEIEHSDVITELIIELIRNSEYVVADLSWERPNVYYEVGYAHAIGKKPILIRKEGTNLHFDLSVYNIPEYRNTTHLRSMLLDRFAAITGYNPRN